MIVPIFEIDDATDDPTVSAGSGRRCVTRTTSAGALVGWMSIRDPVLVALFAYLARGLVERNAKAPLAVPSSVRAGSARASV